MKFFWHLMRHVISGGTSAAVNLAVIYILTSILHVWYIASAVIAYIVALTINFVLQRNWAFRNTHPEVHKQYVQFWLAALLNIALNALFLFILVSRFHLWYFGCQVAILAVLAVMNYLIYHYVIFKNSAK